MSFKRNILVAGHLWHCSDFLSVILFWAIFCWKRLSMFSCMELDVQLQTLFICIITIIYTHLLYIYVTFIEVKGLRNTDRLKVLFLYTYIYMYTITLWFVYECWMLRKEFSSLKVFFCLSWSHRRKVYRMLII